MENTSKALIIAGAILLSILIIGMGMMVYNRSNNIGSTDMSAMEVNAWNSKFLSYEGKQKRSKCKNFINVCFRS